MSNIPLFAWQHGNHANISPGAKLIVVFNGVCCVDRGHLLVTQSKGERPVPIRQRLDGGKPAGSKTRRSGTFALSLEAAGRCSWQGHQNVLRGQKERIERRKATGVQTKQGGADTRSRVLSVPKSSRAGKEACARSLWDASYIGVEKGRLNK